jgi:hypothetical protein
MWLINAEFGSSVPRRLKNLVIPLKNALNTGGKLESRHWNRGVEAQNL